MVENIVIAVSCQFAVLTQSCALCDQRIKCNFEHHAARTKQEAKLIRNLTRNTIYCVSRYLGKRKGKRK